MGKVRGSAPVAAGVDRRTFLRTSAGLAAGAGLFGIGCGDEQDDGRAPVNGPSVAVVRQLNYDAASVKAALARALSLVGGVEALVRGAAVTVKVNLTGSAYSMFSRPPGESYTTHPATALALAQLLNDMGAARVRFVESCPSLATFEGFAAGFGWSAADFSGLGNVAFENTRNLGSGARYARRDVRGTPRLFSYFLLNHSYDETDVMISLAKMKNHITAGVTLAIKNMFGITPNSLYGIEAATRGEEAGSYRYCLHDRARGGVPSLPGELSALDSHDEYYRVPNIVTDVVAARPIDVAIVDGITTMYGGEGPWCQTATNTLRFVSPGLLIAGRDAVATDAVAVRMMGYPDALAARGSAPFALCENHIALAHAAGLGVGDVARINVYGDGAGELATRAA